MHNLNEEIPVRELTLFSLLALTSLSACSAPEIAPGNATYANIYAIADVTVVDVEQGILVPEQTVLVINERIDKIGPHEKIRIPQGATIIDGQGLYLMPGLVDAHVHYLDAPVFGRVMLANGILLVRDMGMPNDFILPLRDELNQGMILGPEMVTTGFILDGSPPLIPQIALGIKTPDEARMAVRQQAEAGVDMIKVYSTLDRDVFLAIMEEAHIQGLKVVGHVPDSIYIEEAAAAGLDSMEHWFGFEKMIARLLGEPVNLAYSGMGSQAYYLERLDEVNMAALQDIYQQLNLSGLTIVPTVVTFKDFPGPSAVETGNLPNSEYLTPNLIAIWKSQWAGQNDVPDFIWLNWARMVNGLNQAGVPLMVGTDLMVPGIIPGFAVHEEMVIWQEAGIPPAEILRSATFVPAQFMGLGDRLGSIRQGKTASMVLVRANPLENIHNAQEIDSVFLRGQYFSREDLDRLLEEARVLAQEPTSP
jgi:imidazolonepropionase-like amidohydrolase